MTQPFSDADISGEDRAFTVDQVMNVTDPSEAFVPPLTTAEEVDNARLETLTRYQRLSDLLEEAIERKDAAQRDINQLREAMALWEPIHNRLVHGPPRRTRTDDDTGEGPVGLPLEDDG